MLVARESVHNKIRLVALLIFVFSLPFSKLANNIAVIVLATNWLFESSLSVKWYRLKNKILLVSFCSIYVLSILGLIYTQNIHYGLFELEKRITLVLLPLIFSTSDKIPKSEIRLIFKTFIIACITASIICFIYAFYRNVEEGHTLSYVFNAIFYDIHLPGRYDYFNYYYFTYFFFSEPIQMHPIYFAMYMLFSCCLTIWMLWDKTGFKNGIPKSLIFFIIYCVIVMVLLSSRTQLFSMLVIGTVFILYYARLKVQLVRGISFILFLIGICSALILLNPISRERFSKAISPSSHFSENKHGEGGLSLRLYQWKYTILAIKSNPLFGTGTGDAQDILQSIYKENNFTIGYENELNPHNQYLQITLELGIVGLLLIILNLAVPIYFAYQEGIWIYIVFIVIYAIGFLTESMLELNKGIVFYSFFNSLFAFNLLEGKAA
jgi:O-antigen ligase